MTQYFFIGPAMIEGVVKGGKLSEDFTTLTMEVALTRRIDFIDNRRIWLHPEDKPFWVPGSKDHSKCVDLTDDEIAKLREGKFAEL